MASFLEYRKKLNVKYRNIGSRPKEATVSTQNQTVVSKAVQTNTPTTKASTGGTSEFEKYRQKLRAKYMTTSFTSDSVNKWFTDSQAALKDMQTFYESDAASKYSTTYGGDAAARVKKLYDQADEVYNWLKANKDSLSNYDELNNQPVHASRCERVPGVDVNSLPVSM